MAHMKDGVELLDAKPVPRPGRWVSAIIVAILAAMAIHGLITNVNFQWGVVFQWLFSASIMQGVAFTIILTVFAMAVGTVLAITMAIMRQSVNPVLRWVAMAYIWFFRGTPIYTQLIFWSLLPTLYPSLSVGVPFLGTLLGWEVGFDTATYFTPFWMAFVGLGLNEGAYLAEIMRAGLLSVSKGQWEAATALGMPRATIFRRIILPQAMRVIVPPIGNETISMLKTTSLVSAIPFTLELTFIARQRGQATFAPVPLLIAAAIWYLVITSLLMVIQSMIEKHFGKGFERRDNAGAHASTDEDSSDGDDKKTSTLKFLDVTP
ncbi:ABC transporter, permease protein [Actinomyces sp. ICM58]|uniref:amino acid ABC transporter permease n=1 Tax=Actinomyces sp. ICM58 TaxID=1105030 RepID=UPI00027714FF|nr:amino acid ABC transporter permease [Actinomyces sp. ICM58]EJN52600.1 ABC transporter, permease protein [Actinomyces sp. ICM58]